jgi:hypothetical protein
MNTQELAKAFTDMCAKGELEAAGKKFWSDDIVSPMCTGINSSFASSWMSRQRARNASTSMRSGFTRSGTVGSSRKAFSWMAGNPDFAASWGPSRERMTI